MSRSVPISIRVVQGVAAHEGVEPVDLEPPLHEVVDTDALNMLFRSTDDSNVSVEFTYRGTHVCIDDSGKIEITATTTDSSSSTTAE
ncbi:HalOD1 output domain-containing protein [Natrinema sp. SYSU A 869]|uniref:HalOD1 output domain-containing protein n=1 Tax=Natrinema sp. SYSU A 869 TaxID=2871694 RepID=UPI001CA3E803|nr:HalOD1 output domain-containing protein [Natrinema sp. SYSU A 869]